MELPDRIDMSYTVTHSNFDEAGYLATNPDVVACVLSGQFKSGHDHFLQYGHAENRQININPPIVENMRAKKMDTVSSYLRKDMAVEWRGWKANFLTPELRTQWNITPTNNVSGHGYSSPIIDYVNTFPGLLLDCGAGRRPTYYSNVVNFEIVDYDTTDVIGVGEQLPFVENTFSCVISVAVLEHVRDPFRCAKEIVRVLRPGGTLFCCVPFLQPVHAYPHHYYNMTGEGLKALFEDHINISTHYIGESEHPIQSLSWILRSWVAGLSEPARRTFLERRVGDLLDPNSAITEAFSRELTEEKRFELASATIVIGTKIL